MPKPSVAAWLDPTRRKNADTTVTYLINKKPYLDYPTALGAGWPIATGIIEGACRHLVKDRMDITGARWGLDGAEAVLRLRALISNDDFDTYWTRHLTREHHRTHLTHYQDHPGGLTRFTPEEPHPSWSFATVRRRRDRGTPGSGIPSSSACCSATPQGYRTDHRAQPISDGVSSRETAGHRPFPAATSGGLRLNTSPKKAHRKTAVVLGKALRTRSTHVMPATIS